MAREALVNTDAPDDTVPEGSFARVLRMQTKLHHWAAADPGRRFDDLFNLVHDPATLWVAWQRVVGNTGARSAGVDGLRAGDIDEAGVQGFLDDLRDQVRTSQFRPMPVRERMIPKPGGSGKMRRLGIPTVADRVIQAALKLVLEPIFETDFVPVSYGFRPRRRAHDAIAEIHLFGTEAIGGCWTLTSKRVSTPSTTPP
jgi:RNA-directed DNA polymerase